MPPNRGPRDVPGVTSPFRAIGGIIKGTENDVLRATYAACNRVLKPRRKRERRRQLGETGRAAVKSRFSRKGAVPRIWEWLESLV
jgi:hypothetical protein